VDPGASEEEVRDVALASEKARRAIDGRDVAQVIVRPPRLVNVVTAP
jgi:leucyl-tRNA synthetase